MKTTTETRSLFLVRHAKALKGGPGIDDIDRQLHDTGILEAYEMAVALLKGGEVPGLIISSPAARAIGTALIFQRVLKLPDECVLVSEKLYDIDLSELFEMVAGLNDNYQSVMLVGHNPTFSSFAAKLDPSLAHMPTGGVVKFNFEAEKWRHSSYINAEKKLFVYP